MKDYKMDALLFAFLLGFASCWAFWRYLLVMKPEISISPYIAKGWSREERGKVAYRIKIYNITDTQVINIKAQCLIARLIDIPFGKRKFGKKLQLKNDELLVLGPKSNLGDSWGISPIYVFTFEPEIDIENLMDQGEKLIFTLSATDALSGTTVVWRKSYSKEDIKYGDFKWGLEFDIQEQIL
jgi:hypothetical protein